MDTIYIIAMLCTIHSSGVDVNTVEQKQLKCQQYYTQCIVDIETHVKQPKPNLTSLAQCILEKK